ncbi:MAG: V-type ATP synthase subunit E [Dehalococcoidia bacterium]|jgi:vacuolar-type H+-ATPase subunit E/Vma4|nr:V-type ATP synthase subunit E [Dehalococcoidia bacterium]
MQRISEAVVDKVREEAQHLISEAEEEAKKELGKAQALRASRLEAEKKRLLTEAGEEAARITAQNAMSARQKTASAKSAVLDDIVRKARESLQKSTTTREQLAQLIRDAMSGLGTADKVFVSVAKKDLDTAREIVKSDKTMSSHVLEVRAIETEGGVIVENESRSLGVDNTYLTRLQMLLPRVLPEISKELF